MQSDILECSARKLALTTQSSSTFVWVIKDTLEKAAFIIFGRPGRGGRRVQTQETHICYVWLWRGLVGSAREEDIKDVYKPLQEGGEGKTWSPGYLWKVSATPRVSWAEIIKAVLDTKTNIGKGWHQIPAGTALFTLTHTKRLKSRWQSGRKCLPSHIWLKTWI